MAYDDLDRLTGVSTNEHWTSASYTYDALDNLRTSQLVKGSGTDTYTYAYHATSNRPTSIVKAGTATWAYTLDARGNVTKDGRREYAWSRANRLASVKDKDGVLLESYEYDGHGRRVVTWRANDGTAAVPVYGLDGKLRLTADNFKGGATTHVYLGDDNIADVFFRWSDGQLTKTYLHTDALGSPVARTDQNRVITRSVYAPYGQLVDNPADLTDNEQEGIGYTGHAYDAVTDLVYMQQRYYDPAIGRFLSIDPVTSFESGDTRHFNRYAYAYNNPYAYTDPDGRCPNCLAGAIAGGVGFLVGTAVNAATQYAVNGEVDISDALVAGGSTAIASAAIGFNPALAANPAVVAGLSASTSVAGSIVSDAVNGEEISGSKALVAGAAGLVAGPLGAKAGDAVENAFGAGAGSVTGEIIGAATGEATSLGLSRGIPAASDAVGRGIDAASDAATKAGARVKQEVGDRLNPEQRRAK